MAVTTSQPSDSWTSDQDLGYNVILHQEYTTDWRQTTGGSTTNIQVETSHNSSLTYPLETYTWGYTYDAHSNASYRTEEQHHWVLQSEISMYNDGVNWFYSDTQETRNNQHYQSSGINSFGGETYFFVVASNDQVSNYISIGDTSREHYNSVVDSHQVIA